MKPTLCLHASSDDANFLYATGMHVPDPAFWFMKGHRSYLVASAVTLHFGASREPLHLRGIGSPTSTGFTSKLWMSGLSSKRNSTLMSRASVRGS